MIFIEIKNNIMTGFIHNQPFDSKYGLGKTREELLQEGILVESIPEPEQIEGKSPVLKYNGTEIYYEYIDASVDEMAALKNQLAEQSQKLAEQEQAIMELTTLLAGGTTNV